MTRKSYTIVLHPDPRRFNAERKKLTIFKPHDLQSIINVAQPNGGQLLPNEPVLEFRRRNQKQMVDLLRCLGIDPSRPDAWEKGFYLLANYHHGVGHLTWRIPRTNRNAVKWTNAADRTLLMEVATLKTTGLSEQQAIKRIVSDPQRENSFHIVNKIAVVLIPRCKMRK